MTEVGMKKTIIRAPRSGGTIPGRSPAASPYPAAKPNPATKPRPAVRPSGSKAPVIIAVVVALTVLVIAGIALSTSHPPAPARVTAAPTAPPAAEAPGQKRWNELGGKTMAEWMKENNKDNKALHERQERINNFHSGQKE